MPKNIKYELQNVLSGKSLFSNGILSKQSPISYEKALKQVQELKEMSQTNIKKA